MIVRKRVSEGTTSSELAERDAAREAEREGHQKKVDLLAKALGIRPSTRRRRRRRGWDPNTIRREVENEFRSLGATVVREEKDP